MKRTMTSVLALGLLFYSTFAQQAAQSPDTYEQLAARLTAHLAQPRFTAASWGVKVVSLDSGKTIFEHNAEKYFNPASNAKLYTGALTLDRLGADFKIKTSIYAPRRPEPDGTLKGDLTIYGRGDPTIAARLNQGNYDKPLERLVEQIKAAGIRKIEGDLIGDESFFNTAPFGSGWEWDDLQEYYGAEVSALSIHDNSLDFFVKPAERIGLPCRITTGPQSNYLTFINRTQTAPKGTETSIRFYRPVAENIVYVTGRLAIDSPKGYANSIAVHNPALLFVTLLKDALAKQGIAVTGRLRILDPKYRDVTPLDLAKFIELGFIESPPMKDIVREMLKPSQNLYAQLLLLQVGANSSQLSATNNQPVSPANSPIKSNSQQTTSNNQTPATDYRLPNTEQQGLEVMTAFLNEVGVKKGDVLLEEGSGLSRKDIITPNATIALLTFMDKHQLAEIYRNGLPIAGVDGTLQNRMKNTPAANNVHAKTGTLRFVYALSGYVTAASGERLAFSIMLNNYFNLDRTIAPREDVDAIPIMLANFGKPQAVSN
ncbi:MAG: D-alanyl-D-alanine carboxypeptidase/D-alanyl-D-alanine-endopeptidase [Acidobacteriota bacterium]